MDPTLALPSHADIRAMQGWQCCSPLCSCFKFRVSSAFPKWKCCLHPFPHPWELEECGVWAFLGMLSTAHQTSNPVKVGMASLCSCSLWDPTCSYGVTKLVWLSLPLHPICSGYWFEIHQSQLIAFQGSKKHCYVSSGTQIWSCSADQQACWELDTWTSHCFAPACVQQVHFPPGPTGFVLMLNWTKGQPCESSHKTKISPFQWILNISTSVTRQG